MEGGKKKRVGEGEISQPVFATLSFWTILTTGMTAVFQGLQYFSIAGREQAFAFSVIWLIGTTRIVLLFMTPIQKHKFSTVMKLQITVKK